MRYVPLTGRILFAAIFMMAGFEHIFSNAPLVAFAQQSGVPLASLAVPITGIMILLGSISILLGYKVKFGAALIFIFLIPTSFMMHNFWAMTDPMAKQINMLMFMKNMSMSGGALILFYFGSGPLSMDKNK